MKSIRRFKSLIDWFFHGRELSEDLIIKWFEIYDAIWLYDGNPEKPHAELSSGLCSNGFFDCMRVLKYPWLTELFAFQLVKKMKDCDVNLDRVDWVIGSPYAAITFSYEVARLLNAVHGFTEKDPEAPKRMLWRRLEIPEGAVILQIEELITTSNTFQEVSRAVKQGNKKDIEIMPIVGCIVHRPVQIPVDYGERRVVSLIEREIWAVKQEDCPLCKQGSKRLKPKMNWKELVGKQ